MQYSSFANEFRKCGFPAVRNIAPTYMLSPIVVYLVYANTQTRYWSRIVQAFIGGLSRLTVLKSVA